MDFLRALITAPVSITVLFLLSKFIGNKQMSSLNLLTTSTESQSVQSQRRWQQPKCQTFGRVLRHSLFM